jgi:hypothetical protein
VRTRPRVLPAALGAAGLLLLRGAASAQGGPPLLTDDPGTPGDGRLEINLAATLERTGDGDAVEAPLLDLNYGLGERLQLKYELPYVFVDEDGGVEEDGLGNSLVGVKWRFRDAGGGGPALSTYPQLELENPGSSSGAVAEPGTALLIPLEAQWNLGDRTLNLELGRNFRDQGPDEWIAGLALTQPLRAGFDLLAEIHGEASADLASSQGVFNVGSRVALGPRSTLLASVGSGLWSDDSDERPDLLAYVGVQFRP